MNPAVAKMIFIATLLGMAFFIAIEMLWSRRTNAGVYTPKETFANLFIFAGFHVSKFLFRGYQLFWLTLFAGIAPFHLPRNGWTFLATFILADFLYYWHHRIMHEWRFFWAFHEVHHSATRLNLTASYRLNWFSGLIGIFFYLPLVLLGFPPLFIVASIGLGLLYQFFQHTEAVGKLGFLEGILNTPSAHRVHHASNQPYLDKNYGGVLMIWDRLFGTYAEEREPCVYGITTGFVSHNPFTLIFHGFLDLARGVRTRG
jgi:sterol desaturase/sphingolipid hydroxylase (fatty acid hydroxylase superfamily)